jgi:hypothetical protein
MISLASSLARGQIVFLVWVTSMERRRGDQGLSLKAKGVEFVVEPKRMPYSSTSIFKDVDGNSLVLSSK